MVGEGYIDVCVSVLSEDGEVRVRVREEMWGFVGLFWLAVFGAHHLIL